jgi:Ca2+/Na+ antiporter
VNIALVLGVCILIIVLKRPRYPSFLLSIAKEEMGSLQFGLFIASIIPLALLYIGYASRYVGVILVGIFIYYTIQLTRSKRTKPESTEVQTSERSKIRRYTLLALAGAFVISARKGHFDLALGNIVGSGFVNITLILGVALIASPLTIDIAAFSNLAVFSLIINLFLWYFLGSERISWREGVLLLSLYVLFLVISFGGSSIVSPSTG